MAFPMNPGNGRIHTEGTKVYIWTKIDRSWTILPFSLMDIKLIQSGVLNNIGTATGGVVGADEAALRTSLGTTLGDLTLGTFTGTTIPDNLSVKAAIQTIEIALEATATITGQFLGSAVTFLTLPIVDALTAPASNGDWAILTTDDGLNFSGIYAYNGAAFVFVMEIADNFTLDASTFDGNLTTTDDTLQEVAQAFDDYLGSDKLFADDTTVAPAAVGIPTSAEILTFAGTNRDTIIGYNGTDVDGLYTYIFHIDKSGNITLLKEPSASSKAPLDVTVVTATAISPDFDVNIDFLVRITSASTGDIPFDNPAGTLNEVETVTIAVLNSDGSGDRNISFGSSYLGFDGSAIGVVAVSSLINYRILKFEKTGAAYRLSSDSGVTGTGIDDVLAIGQALTADRTLDFSDQTLEILGEDAVSKIALTNDGNSQLQMIGINAATSTLVSEIRVDGGVNGQATMGVNNTTNSLHFYLSAQVGAEKVVLRSLAVSEGTAKVGQVLTLTDATFGIIEYKDIDLGNNSVLTASATGIVTITESDFLGSNQKTYSTNAVTLVNLPSAALLDTEDRDVQTTFIFTEPSTVVFDEPDNGALGFETSVTFTAPCTVTVFYSPVANKYSCTLSASGGLTQNGIVTALIPTQGIYTAEGTNATGELFTATDAQSRVMVSSTLAGIGTIITVPTGESLNGTLNGSYTTQSDGELLLFLDNGVGAWTVQVLGASQVDSLVISTLTIPNNGTDLQALTTGTSGTDYATSIPLSFTNTGTVTNDPTSIFNTANDYVEINKAGKYRVTMLVYVNDRGGSATSAIAIIGDTINEKRRSVLTLTDSWRGTYSFNYIEDFLIGDKLDIRFTHNTGESHDLEAADITIEQLPSSEVVLAGMVTPTTLAYGSLRTTQTAFTGVDDPIAYEIEDYNIESIVTNTTTFTVPTTGVYDVRLISSCDFVEGTAGDRHIYVVKNNVNPVDDATAFASRIFHAQSYADSSSHGNENLVAGGIASFTAGDTLISYFHAADGGDRVKEGTFSIKQLPESTVVDPDDVPVQALKRCRTTQTINQSIPANTDKGILFDTLTHNAGCTFEAVTGNAIIPQDGFYDIIGAVRLVTDATTITIDLSVTVNGVQVTKNSQGESTNNQASVLSSYSNNFSTGDVIGLEIRHDDGNTNSTASSSGKAVYLDVQQRSSYSIINPDDLIVDDQASSGYMDIGTMRMQWGVEASGNSGTINLPAPFANSLYSVTANTVNDNRMVGINTHTVASFSYTSNDQAGSANASGGLRWQAIGLKP